MTVRASVPRATARVLLTPAVLTGYPVRAHHIAGAHERVCGLFFGGGDMAADKAVIPHTTAQFLRGRGEKPPSDQMMFSHS